MKPSQTLVLVVAVVGMIGGVAFVRNWISAPPTEFTAKLKPERYIDYRHTVALGSPEYELHGKGHYDFVFQNNNDEPVEIGSNDKNCNCSEVLAVVLTDAECQRVRDLIALVAQAQVLEAAAGLLHQPVGLSAAIEAERRRFVDQCGGWKTLMDKDAKEKEPLLVPPQATGYVRLKWQSEQAGPRRLTAKVWVQPPGDPKSRGGETSLEVPVLVVLPVRVHPDRADLADLRPNQQAHAEFLCWSSTRPTFGLTVKEETGHPCFVCQAVPLSGEEFAKAVPTLAPHAAQVLSVYRVTVTVYERLSEGGPQMDLGPYQRKVRLETDLPDQPPLTLTLAGTVRGDVTVGTEDLQDKIVLKTFPRSKGTTVTVPVEAAQPGMNLLIEKYEPPYLKVDFKAKDGPGGSRWDLTVTVPPNRAFGRLPDDSAVVLKTGDGRRRIRIPVLGRATQ